MSKKISIFLFLSVCFLAKAQQVTTITGGAGSADGNFLNAHFSGPWGLCTDPTGTIIYVADSFNHRIRKIDLTSGLVTTIAGSTEGYADGVGTAAKFALPRGVCMDNNGNLYVAEANNHKIRKIDLSTNTVTTFAGSTQGYTNGLGTNAKFNEPTSICIDSNNNLYVSEWQGNKIRKITPTGQVTNLAGSGVAGFADGTGTNAKFDAPQGLCIDNQNNIYVSDTANFRVRKITPSGTVTTIAGTGVYGHEDGPVATAKLKDPTGISIDNNNNLYVIENHEVIRKIDLTANMVSTFIDASILNDGDPNGMCFKNNTIYFTEFGQCKIKKITDLLSSEQFNKNDFYLFPNPNNGSFSINSKVSKVLVYNLTGQLIKQFEGSFDNLYNYDIQSLSSGTYLVKIIDYNSNEKNLKLIKW
jgi:sugar lactone lactonase YvrE